MEHPECRDYSRISLIDTGRILDYKRINHTLDFSMTLNKIDGASPTFLEIYSTLIFPFY
jgi:hypothetical protein